MRAYDLLNFNSKNRLPQILQTQNSECGLVCLAMILGFYGHQIDMVTLRQRCGVSTKGLNLKGLIAIAEKLQLSSRPVTLELEELSQLQTPCVLHWDMNHFVVLKKATKNDIHIHDPARGLRIVTIEEAGNHFSGVAVELMQTSQFEEKKEKAKVRLSDFWNRAKGLKRGLLQILGLSICLQLLSLTSPFYMQLVVDEAIVSNDMDLLKLLAMGFGLLAFINIMITVLRSWISLYLGNLLSFQMVVNLFRHLLYLPAEYFSSRHMGDIVSRFGSMEPIKNMVTSGAIAVILDGLMAIITLIMIFIYSPMLAWIVLLSLVLYAIVRIIAYRPLRQLSEEGIVADAKENSHFMESIRAIQSIKLFGKESNRMTQWQNKYADAMNLDIRLGKLNIGFNTIHSVLGAVENILIVYLGAMLVIEREFSVGMLYAFMSYKGQFVGAMSNLINQAIALKMLGLHMERLADIALTPVEEGLNVTITDTDKPQPGNHIQINGNIEIIQLSYRYAETEPWLFKDINLSISQGQSIAIIGESGCGKTTLLKLLIGLLPYDKNDSGSIIVDGAELNRIDLQHYRSQIATVMQEDQLLSGSLMDNICMFQADYNEALIEEAATLASIHHDIVNMPMGYNTLVGDMGNSLSGGQKQRLFLARALYHKPKILFMDEATSHLDTALEWQINTAVSQLPMTRIIVAHRPQTIEMADRVVILQNGKLTEVTKGELFNRGE